MEELWWCLQIPGRKRLDVQTPELKARWRTVATAHKWDRIIRALAENAETLANKNSILKDVK